MRICVKDGRYYVTDFETGALLAVKRSRRTANRFRREAAAR